MMRIESDAIGSLPIYEEAYYGIHSYRAKENFAFSQQKVDWLLIQQVARIKAAAAIANQRSGTLSKEKAAVIVTAAEEIMMGKWQDEFIVDTFQGGAGTSTNMNVNEVIANRGLELLGHKKGDYHYLHPLDDVNQSQSTNDVYPSAGRLTLLTYMEQLTDAVNLLIDAWQKKATAYQHVEKMGRTQLQEAVPMMVSDSFSAYASSLIRCRERLQHLSTELLTLNLGGTAIGTSLNASFRYQEYLYEELNRRFSRPLRPANDLIDATQHADTFAALSGVLKTLAIALTKSAHDMRLLSSGPRTGFHELNLPARQAGSSIMPGKVNPVIPEVVSQIAFQVVGNDGAITFAAASGELELNAFEPVIFHNLFESCQLLTNACCIFAEKCVTGITVNETVCRQAVACSTGTVTALAPEIGYEKASALVKAALAANCSVEELLVQDNQLSATYQ
ncbi:aspartate ammonia-lyase [Enterococcus sp. 8G7_MSG3316]|uniref:Aspartate ammonia-lyase n=1 Tax=Candidatus Enterococcus testudinis TaxID=1834191 RepID=A0A242A8W9_9ENTE|nr:aspartate ammonia-lyase [Enterococcus sp. 8G7_MSG3316]OTN77478.1 aspartate ammonia-lyase [Enterococcus sp. 8G7_MSG3316]